MTSPAPLTSCDSSESWMFTKNKKIKRKGWNVRIRQTLKVPWFCWDGYLCILE